MAAAPPTMRTHASVPDRVAALLADLVILSVLAFFAAVAVSVVVGPAVDFDGGAESIGDAVGLQRDVVVIDALVVAAIGAAYFIGSWTLRGHTPGQRLLGLDVVGAGDGGRPSAVQAAWRWLALVGPFSATAVLAAAWPALDNIGYYTFVALWYAALLVTTARSSSRRGLHDLAAGTAVATSSLVWQGSREDPARGR
jgi:uncharacterized RDD family membrane protein YckC